jgi:hypothetical protein
MRTRYVAVALLLPLVVLAQQPVEQELIRLENERVQLFRTGNGDWGKFYVDDYVGFLGDGRTRDLAQTKAQKTDVNYAVTDLSVQVYGDSALMTGYQLVGGVRMRSLRVWTKRPTGWRIVAFQATPISAPGQPSDKAALATAKLSAVSPPLALSPVAREVLKLDEQYVGSDRRNDDAAGKRMETDRYFFVSRFGDAGGTTNPLKDLRLADVRVRTYGDLAVVTGQVQWTDQQGFSPGPLLFTRVWVKQAGQWKVAAEQRTAITVSGTTSN